VTSDSEGDPSSALDPEVEFSADDRRPQYDQGGESDQAGKSVSTAAVHEVRCFWCG
jgi:hypothetical protein